MAFSTSNFNLVEKYMPPEITCYWCTRVNPPVNNLQRRLCIGTYLDNPICQEHADVFDQEIGPWRPV